MYRQNGSGSYMTKEERIKEKLYGLVVGALSAICLAALLVVQLSK